MTPEKKVKQAATDAQSLFTVAITMLMCSARSLEQDGTLLGER